MRPPSKPPSSSSFWSSSKNLILLVVTPLTVFSVVGFVTLGPERSSWSPFSSPRTWRAGFPLKNNESDVIVNATTTAISSSDVVLTNETIQLEQKQDTLKHNESDVIAVNASTTAISSSDVLLTNETIQLEQKQDILKHNESDEIAVTAMTKVVRRYRRLEKLEASLAKARSFIKEAALVRNLTSIHKDSDYVPQGPMYRNANAFHRSYLEMEKLFKIYVYEEGEVPLFHDGPCRSIYSSEGRFIHELEKGRFYRTRDPDEAHVYFLPFSVVEMVHYLYVDNTYNTHAIELAVVDYINVIANKHPFWNRSHGADHFMLSCHDWGPSTSSYVPQLYHNSIRVLCNANTSEGFNPIKDASLPEINLVTGDIKGIIGGLSPSRRPILAFFAGRLHGYIRYLLLKEWQNKDQDVQVYEQVPKGVSYVSMLKKSKFCLCPSGYEVASPRIVEAIYAECVPVLISDSYVPPFSDVLNWKSFSVQVEVKDIPNIKNLLMRISQRQYLRMVRRVRQVQRHFVVNESPKRFDVFHMIVHSIWLRRLNIHIEDSST